LGFPSLSIFLSFVDWTEEDGVLKKKKIYIGGVKWSKNCMVQLKVGTLEYLKKLSGLKEIYTGRE
jgi:hypothetical protein